MTTNHGLDLPRSKFNGLSPRDVRQIEQLDEKLHFERFSILG